MSRRMTSVFSCVLALFATHALAGPLAVDLTSMPGFHGTQSFVNSFGLAGTVDYAVWAPGTFPVGNFLGYTPSGPSYYVYTYQVHETGPADLSQLSVTLTGPVDAGNIGDFFGNNGFGLVAGGASISAFVVPFDTANWLFDAIPTGGSTDGLAYSSLNAPTWAPSRLVDDGTVAFTLPVPSPNPNNAPEPGTLTLASLGLGVLGFQYLRRRRRLTTN